MSHKTEIIISDSLRYCLLGVTNNKVWFYIKLFMQVIFLYFNFSHEEIFSILFSHMWRNMYCYLIHTESMWCFGSWADKCNTWHSLHCKCWRAKIIFSTANAEYYIKLKLGIQHNWSLSTPGSLLILLPELSLKIKDHITMSLKIFY